MRKDNRKVLSPSDLTTAPILSPSGLLHTRSFSGLRLICNARSLAIAPRFLTNLHHNGLAAPLELLPTLRPKSTSNNKANLSLDSRIKSENDNTFVKGCHGWKRSSGAAAVAAISVVFCLGAGEAMAQCAVPPTCESLGYDLTATDCEGKRALKCPFDASKVFCSQTKYEGIAVGNIYYSDGTISDSVIAGKTPVGVVAYVERNRGLMIALEGTSEKWSAPGYSNLSCIPDLERGGAEADMNGKTNTACILSEKSSGNTYPAAEYCNNYKPVSSGKGSSGWYLPALGELHLLSYNYGVINISLSKLSKTRLSSDYYWSSSEKDVYYYQGRYVWLVRPSDGKLGDGDKNYDTYRVRCFLAF